MYAGCFGTSIDANVRVLTDAELQVLPESEAQRLAARYGEGIARIIAPNVFEYHYAPATDGVDSSVWWLIFYDRTRFLAIVNDNGS